MGGRIATPSAASAASIASRTDSAIEVCRSLQPDHRRLLQWSDQTTSRPSRLEIALQRLNRAEHVAESDLFPLAVGGVVQPLVGRELQLLRPARLDDGNFRLNFDFESGQELAFICCHL